MVFFDKANAHAYNYFKVFEDIFVLHVKSAVFRCYTKIRKEIKKYKKHHINLI